MADLQWVDDEMPWPWYTQHRAAKLLGVDRRFLDGLANNPIRSTKRRGKTGSPVALFNKEDIDVLKIKMEKKA